MQAVLFLFLLGYPADLTHLEFVDNEPGHLENYRVLFSPLITREGYWEEVVSVEFDPNHQDPEVNEEFPTCIIHLKEVEMEYGEGIPLDQTGQQLIRWGDAWISTISLERWVLENDCSLG